MHSDITLRIAVSKYVTVGLFCLVTIATSPLPIQSSTFSISENQHQRISAEDFKLSNTLLQEMISTTSITLTDTLSSSSPITFKEMPTNTSHISPTAAFSVPVVTMTPNLKSGIVASPSPEFPQPMDSSEPSPLPDGGFINKTISVIIETPLIPLGIALVLLISFLAIMLLTPQRRTKVVQKRRGKGTETTPLIPKTAPAQESAFLSLKDKPEVIFSLAINEIRIGRAADNTIVITPEIPGSETVSHYHARLYRLEKWVLEDLDSTNGIYVNGQRTGRNYLSDGWEIGIGGVCFIFHTSMVEA